MPTRTALLCSLLLSACAAAPRWTYEAPPGMPADRLESDRLACHEEARIARLAEEQVTLEQHCMMDRGYRVKTLD